MDRYGGNMSNNGYGYNGYGQNVNGHGYNQHYQTNNNCLQENRNYGNTGYNCFRGGTRNRQRMKYRPY